MVKMFPTCFDDTLQHLSMVEKVPLLYYDLYGFQNMRLYQGNLRLFKLLLWCCNPAAAADTNLLADFDFLATSIAQLFKLEPGTDSFALTDAQQNSLIKKIDEKRLKCIAQINMDNRYRHHLISSCSSSSTEADELFPSNNETVEFLDFVHITVSDVLKHMDKGILITDLDSQIESLVDLLFLLRNMVYYTNPETDLIFRFNVHHWAHKVACLSLLRHLVGIDEGTGRRLIVDLQIINACNPFFIKLCFQVIKDAEMKPEDRLLFGEFVSRFVDFFLENLMFVLNDDFPLVREGLIFIIAFIADPPADDTVIHSRLMPFVREQIYTVLDMVSDAICFFCICEANMDLAGRGSTVLGDLLKSIDEVRGDIVNLYVRIPPLSSWSSFPRSNRLGHFECLLAYLENLEVTMKEDQNLVSFFKHQFFTIYQELLPLRLFLQNTSTMQNEHNGLKDIWEEISCLLYQADFAIKSAFFIDDPIWYNLTCLSFVVSTIKDIRYKVRKIDFKTQTEGSHISKTEDILPLMSSIEVPKPPTSTSIVEAVFGFEKETNLLIDRLECGSKQLDIVSIVGMGGIGKTTLANKLYNEPSVKNHFHKRAFCSVSQLYRKRNALSSILSDLSLNDDEIRRMSDDDLAQRLRQSLLGSRYLIVLDDIWDINVWDDMKASFPNDCNGSRVIFTTRINSLSKSTPCPLPFLSNDESWKLLRHKIFHNDLCPPHLLEVGKTIAKNCKGLPLSIVVIAGLLARTEGSLPQWIKVAETLSSFASSEGCRDIIKLSYEQLPEALKSCFLYLGAFSENYILDAKDLAILWVAEGFVLKSGDSSLHKIAKSYLKDLGDRSLVTITKGTGIKTCRVHDLIRDFCRTEAQEKHYMCYINAHYKSFPMSNVLYQYRISIEAEGRSLFDAKPRGRKVHSLHYFEDSPYYVSKASVEVNSLQSFLHNFKLVRVLNLVGVMIDGEFPMTITTLVHLRYLALRFSAALYVPPDIINLWNLETLKLSASEYSGMYLSQNGDWTENLGAKEPAFVMENTYNLGLPKDFWQMKRLSHVELKAFTKIALDDVIGGVSLLPDLVTIGFLFIPHGKYGEELLRRLSNVRKFRCACSALWDPHLKKNRLPKLAILTKLESLSLVHAGWTKHPYMFSFPKTIRKLTLKRYGLSWNEFSATIGMLPCLEVLVLNANSFDGEVWNVEDDQFPMIKSLKLDNLDIEEWNASTDSFPSLEKLNVSLCLKLIAIPPCFGELETLMSIEVHACKKKVADSAIQIQEVQFDSGNESFRVDLIDIQT